jgi:hypothetical protein
VTAPAPPALADRLTVSPDVVFRELEGDAVLLDLESGTYFGLNAVGTRIWSLIQERDSLRAVLDAITAEYDAMPEVLERDLLRLAAELCAKGLTRVDSRHG